MRQRALVALARIEEDAQLLSYARLLADFGLLREVRFLHVTRPETEPAQLAAIQEAVSADVRRYFGTPAGRIIASCHVEPGDRLDTLLEGVHQWRSDYVLLGHRKSRRGLRSLAQRLAMISPCSVWLVPEGSPMRLRRILAPVDFSEHAADGLSTALDVARAVDIEECVALHVGFDESLDCSAEHQARYSASQRKAFDDFLRDVDTSGVQFESLSEESSHPAQAILRVAQARESDLIVMNTRGRSRAASILVGNVTTEVLVDTGVPMLIVKHFGAVLGLFRALKEGQFWNRKNPKFN